MLFYVLLGFAIVAVAFLVMISIQLLRIEKMVSDMAEIAELNVKKLFQKKEG